MSNAAQTLGKFRIVDQLGSGGFATVYQAVDTSLDRDVALKVLHPQLLADVTFVQRFKIEARTVANLRHPNIITVYEVGEMEDRLFLAMELARGPSLATLIKERERIPWEETLVLIEQLCEGLEHAHGQGIVHRDLKPSNVLIDDDMAMLSDFGFARVLGQSSLGLSMSGGIVGTPGYIAPEVWDLNTAGVPADIYALGCIVYEMLTGTVLFTGATPMQAMRAHDKGPEYPDTWPEDVPAGIEAVLNTALAQAPSARYGSASKFLTALKALDAIGEETPASTPEPEPVAPAMQETTPALTAPGAVPDTTPAMRADAAPARRSAPKLMLGLGALLLVVLLAGGAFAMGWLGSGESPPAAAQSMVEPEDGSDAALAALPTNTARAEPTAKPTNTPEPTATPEPPPPTITAGSEPAEATEELAPADEEASSLEPITHSVQAGETLAAIANLYGVTVEDISTANPGVDSNQLTIGQELTIPNPTVTSTSADDEEGEPADTPTPTPAPTMPPTATVPPSDPNLLDFETSSMWRTGDQKNGTMVVVGEEVHAGSGAAKISYDFSSTGNDFVVFTTNFRQAWTGRPGSVSAWVYGDGAGHFLNIWIYDSSGQTWQVPLGRVTHTGWQQMSGLIQTGQDWPWTLIAGPEDDDSLDYPLTFTAFILDDTPDTYVGSGIIYIDDVEAVE